MIRTQLHHAELQEETALVCDRCGREVMPDEYSEWNEALRLRFTGGYGSVFGAGARGGSGFVPALREGIDRPILPYRASTGLKN